MKKYLLFIIIAMIFPAALHGQVVVQGNITTNVMLTNDTTYLLKGYVRVEEGGVLNIEAGTIIYGENSSLGTLIIKPGGKINAVGTSNAPIIFTSEFAKSGSARLPNYGDWGGIILLGKAKINVPGGTAAIEGPGDSYGGNDDEDNSGVMQFVRIEYPGIPFSLNNEINGLTFGGVGRGTTIDHIQVSYSGDDSYEWFGGTVNAKYLIAYRGWDDDFDTDYGYSGKLQFLFAVRDPLIADQSSSNGFESDNDGAGSVNQPITSPTWWNVTLLGPKLTDTTTINSLYKRGMHLRRNSQNKVNNTIIAGWPTGLYLDGTGTINGAVNGSTIANRMFIAGATKVIDTTKSNGTFNPSEWFATPTFGNQTFGAISGLQLTNPLNINSPDLQPLPGSSLLTGGAVPPNDGFFDVTAVHVGAFGTTDWSEGWARYNLGNYITSVENDEQVISGFELSQNYPNPFNPSTTINFVIPEASQVTLKVYDVLGNEVTTLVDEFKQQGRYSIKFDAGKLSSGIYFYRINSGKYSSMQKMMLLK